MFKALLQFAAIAALANAVVIKKGEPFFHHGRAGCR
jgi:hypothetical protein